ncbi:hypothetical protein [Sphingomonas segetis]|jgi:hypothetical protein|uniref:hypothetical protein n=1 Tax=Sphingomonas segetis TaxID=1104779 RepID=UPI0012D2A7AD|nr:hypothetical protein [Sphingomonas segetis]
MNKLIVALTCLAACSQQKQPHAVDTGAENVVAAARAPTSMPAQPRKAALMIPIPKDPAQLERLLAMGYSVHEDHLHAPGVTSCPKMSENPVM